MPLPTPIHNLLVGKPVEGEHRELRMEIGAAIPF